jgi:hypothetical protein
LLDLAQPPAQPHQFLALHSGQPFLAWQRLAAIAPILGNPVGNALRCRAELTRELRWRSAGAGQLNNLLAKFRRIGRF